ncbi:MAG TPA: hypothetical protein VHA56_05970 [Mucilaginibacter sp.]|nr:hypothetical protein [Mucilaginibacter sp.]
MKDFLITRSRLLLCSVKEWNVTLAFWGIVLLIEFVINVLK